MQSIFNNTQRINTPNTTLLKMLLYFILNYDIFSILFSFIYSKWENPVNLTQDNIYKDFLSARNIMKALKPIECI